MNLIDSLRLKTEMVHIFIYKDYPESQMMMEAVQLKDQRSLDSLFGYIGQESRDTCDFWNEVQGQIQLYSDTTWNSQFHELFFTLTDNCSGLYDGIDNGARRFTLTTKGVNYLKRLTSEGKKMLETYIE